MVCPPQSCCGCPPGTPGHGGGNRSGGFGSPMRSPPGSPMAASTPRRNASNRGGNNRSRQNESVAEETLNEIEELQSLGVLQRSQMEFDIGHSAENAVDQLDLSHSLVLQAVPRRGDQSMPHHIDENYLGGAQGGGNESLGLMDQRAMARSMLDAGNEFDFSGPDDLGPHPIEALQDMSSGLENYSFFENELYQERNVMGDAAYHVGGDDDGDEDVEYALEAESQMTVYDPEDLNMTMAPRTNNIETRREVLYGTFLREYEDTEEEENEAIQELLLDFHQRRRNEASRLMDE